MRAAGKFALGIVLVGVMFYCAIGYAATFEPLDPSVRTTWRVIYGVLGLVAIGGLIGLARRQKN